MRPFTLIALVLSVAPLTFEQSLPSSGVADPSITNATHSLKSEQAQATSSQCPNHTGVYYAFEVPVGHSLTLVLVLGSVAPAGGITFQLSSDTPSIVAAGDPRQAFLPQVFVPAGSTYSNTFTLYGINVGQTVFRATTSTPGRSFSLPEGAWDVNQNMASKFVDANPARNHCRQDGNSPLLSSDPNVLATCGVTVQGTASDGVSQLLLRTVSGLPGTACYQIVSQSPFDQGSIQAGIVATQVFQNLDYAFSSYTAPSNYGDTSDSRTVTVTFTFTPSVGNGNTTSFQAQATIIRPPIMLLHGIWSDSGTWSQFYLRNDPFYTTFAADYKSTHDSSFSTNVGTVQGFVGNAIIHARAKGYAVTQADVIGHSMGGLLTRLYIGSQQFLRPDNFNKGDIRRVVTLDTPHYGTNFANLLVALHRAQPAETEETVKNIIPVPDARVTNGAVCDLAENSAALNALSGTNVQAEVITATGGPAGSSSGGLFWGGVLGFRNFEGALTYSQCTKRNFLFQCTQRAFRFPQDVVNAFRFRESNDAIVPQSSQQGGLSSLNYSSLFHFGESSWGITVYGPTNTQEVATQAFQLLDGGAALPLPWASAFPAVLSDGNGGPRTVPGRGSGLDQQDYADQCGPSGPMKTSTSQELTTVHQVVAQQAMAIASPQRRSLAQQQVADPRVTIVSPVNGQEFRAGDFLSITVKISSPLIANDIAVDLIGLSRIEGSNYDGSTYEASFNIPPYYAGPLPITPSITDTNNNLIIGMGVVVAVRPPPPTAVSLAQSYFSSGFPPSTAGSLSVRGLYPNSVQLDISSALMGTSYQSSNTSVVTVDADGTFQSVGPGTALITVANGDLTDFATFDIEDPASPLPPQDVTAQIDVQRSGFRLDRQTGFFVQNVVLTNSGSVPIAGPLFLVLPGLPSSVVLTSKSGLTQSIAPAGSAFLRLVVGGDGLSIQPGQSISVLLQFLNANGAQISYTPKLTAVRL